MSLFAAGFVCPCRGGTKSETNSRTCGQHATACGNKTASVKREGRIMELKRGQCGFEFGVEQAHDGSWMDRSGRVFES